MEKKLKAIKQQILTAIERGESLKIIGGNSKVFLGRDTVGSEINMADYSGVISYEPTELYITVRAGTLLSVITKLLAEQGQMLAFEPAEINDKTTIGGVIATGLSGPRRPYSGSARDFVLGVRCINGLAKELSFGGQVMKNVAGYDLSRLMTGAYGTLGIITEVTLKVLPQSEFESTGVKVVSRQQALSEIHDISSRAAPVSASCYDGEKMIVRFSGNEKFVKESLKSTGFEEYKKGNEFWKELRDYNLSIFHTDKPIWRLSVPSASNVNLENDDYLIDWGGSQYWLASDRSPNEIFTMADDLGGSALLFRGGDRNGDVFQPLSSGLFKLQQELKRAFDPHKVLNLEKMYVNI
ncbi:MAG TPA: glycolate oxidase subunit GlcE [Thiotrichaceae bacterium]|jgi:glycolate oxidase FAD binding subunit|nr:glycolate oxidase subunit GlcE [Thiotrichaceae bacterium]HIM08981.1 glycolate oxidase subunit GlcE [Gammaproteobacteria bacterium]